MKCIFIFSVFKSFNQLTFISSSYNGSLGSTMREKLKKGPQKSGIVGHGSSFSLSITGSGSHNTTFCHVVSTDSTWNKYAFQNAVTTIGCTVVEGLYSKEVSVLKGGLCSRCVVRAFCFRGSLFWMVYVPGGLCSGVSVQGHLCFEGYPIQGGLCERDPFPLRTKRYYVKLFILIYKNMKRFYITNILSIQKFINFW